MKKIIIDIENGTEVIEDLTQDEIDKAQARHNEFEAQELSLQENAQRKLALLDRLGITEDEARLLLG
jgi:hypothetical protein